MSDHIPELLGAYLDGELGGGQLRKVEAHLEDCQDCQAEFNPCGALSAALQSAPSPDFTTAERLAAEVALRLPRTPVKPTRQRAFEFGWWMAPVGLLLAWIFLGTTLLVSNLVTTAGQLGLLSSAAAWLSSGSANQVSWAGTLAQFGLLAGNSLQWAETTEMFTRTALPPLAWQVSIALLYLCWMAILWARHMRQEPEGLR